MATLDLDELFEREVPFAESTGGPLLVVPSGTASQWWGCNGADGEYAYGGDELTDYDRASDAGEFPTLLETPDGGWALVLEMPDPGTLWRVDEDTVLVVQWVGAETEAELGRSSPPGRPGWPARRRRGT